jgi:hypothetical protein
MSIEDAGGIASSAGAPVSTTAPKPTSPAAQKFAKYLARRMKPMIEHRTIATRGLASMASINTQEI